MSHFLTWAFTHSNEAIALLFTINAFLIACMIVLENKEPERSNGWLLALFAFPLVGFILYIFFGHNWHRPRNFFERLRAFQETNAWKRFAQADALNNQHRPDIERQIRHLATSTTGLRSTEGNRVTILTNAAMKYPQLLSEIAAAKHSIDMEYFIFRYDEIGREILDLLKKKAREGLRVRFLVDGYGSFGLGRRVFADLRAAGVQAKYFAPLATLFYFFKVNYRDHRKIIVIDSSIAFTGGINIGREYLGRSPIGAWRDTSLELRGPCVEQFQMLFEESWRRSTHLAHVESYSACPPFSDGEIVNVIPSGPDAEWFSVQRVYVDLINQAKRELIIQTPYYIPDASIQEALMNAALRGVDVRLNLPFRPDAKIFHWAAMTYLGDLMRSGVRVFEYSKGFLHQKVIIADRALACIGTCNIDIRSLRLDFEVNVVLSGHASIHRLLEDAELDLSLSRELSYESYLRRPIHIRALESLMRLISPLL
ncbi:MAG: cardiolipin synthase [Patescibacteria group bacterium]